MSIDLSTIWNGAYGGLYHEVVFEDCYRVKQLDFTPDLVIDLGANVGTFTKMVHELWPDAFIVAIEPDTQNCDHFVRNIPDTDHIHLIQAAIGNGEIYRHSNAINGAHESYVSASLGYAQDELVQGQGKGVERTNIPTITLSRLESQGISLIKFKEILIKIDIEGAESVIFTDPLQMEVLRQAAYVAIEIHQHALHAGHMEEVRTKTKQALQSLELTHDCEYIHPMFYARRKKIA